MLSFEHFVNASNTCWQLVLLAGMEWLLFISFREPHLAPTLPQVNYTETFLVLCLGLDSILAWRSSGFCNGVAP